MRIYTFFNTQRTRKDGTFPVYICIARPKRLYIETGLFTHKKFEDDVFPRTESNHRAKTARLNDLLNKIEQVAIENSLATDKELRSIIKTKVLCEYGENYTLVKLLNDYADKSKAENTKNRYYITARKVERFDKNADLRIGVKWLEDFEKHLESLGNKVNTIAIDMKNIRTIFGIAIDDEITTNFPFRRFRIKTERTAKRNISIEQLRMFKDMELRKTRRRYRDFFMLSFYLIGMNIKDLLNAKPEQVINGRLEYRRFKTGKLYSIKIEPEAMEIIERYRGKEYLLRFIETAKVDCFTNQLNICLKKIIPGISSYYARHTWATIASELDITIDTISAALGHSYGAQVTNVYVDFDQKKVDVANRKVIDEVIGLGETSITEDKG